MTDKHGHISHATQIPLYCKKSTFLLRWLTMMVRYRAKILQQALSSLNLNSIYLVILNVYQVLSMPRGFYVLVSGVVGCPCRGVSVCLSPLVLAFYSSPVLYAKHYLYFWCNVSYRLTAILSKVLYVNLETQFSRKQDQNARFQLTSGFWVFFAKTVSVSLGKVLSWCDVT